MLLISICTVGQAFCPFKCQCDDRKMKVVCESEAHLDIIPITLNPGIKEIHLRGNQIRWDYYPFYLVDFFVDFRVKWVRFVRILITLPPDSFWPNFKIWPCFSQIWPLFGHFLNTFWPLFDLILTFAFDHVLVKFSEFWPDIFLNTLRPYLPLSWQKNCRLRTSEAFFCHLKDPFLSFHNE